MARQKMKGSLVYEILIVVLAALLVGSIMYPKSVWERIDRETTICRDQMHRVFDAELLYLQGSGTNNYDSSLVKVFQFVRSDSVWEADSILATLRDTFYVNLVKDYLRDYQDIATKKATDSAFYLVEHKDDSVTALTLNAILDTMFSRIYTCPTTNDTYRIEIVDTSAAKILKVYCPITQEQADSINSDFWFSVIGGGRIENHGHIDNGQPSWKEKKRK
jgi:hypothetical protein